MFRLALAGTHSVGKTTLARAVADTLGFAHVQGDFTREIVGQALATRGGLEAFSPAEKWGLQEQILQGFAAPLAAAAPVVTDGSPLTSLPYGRALIGPGMPGDFPSQVAAMADGFTHHFYLPPEAELEADGYRSPDPAFRMAMDSATLDMLADRPFHVLTGPTPQRVQQIAQVLGMGPGPRPFSAALTGPMAAFLTTADFLPAALMNTNDARFRFLAEGAARGQDWGALYAASRGQALPGRAFYLRLGPDALVDFHRAHGLHSGPAVDRRVQEERVAAWDWLAAHHVEIVTLDGNLPLPELQAAVKRHLVVPVSA